MTLCLIILFEHVFERYGWVPDIENVPDDIREKYQWIPGISITHMEILHGAYR